MDTLIVWHSEAVPVLYIVPTQRLVIAGQGVDFLECNGVILNKPGCETTHTISDKIEYLARLLGEEPHYGPLPTLAAFLRAEANFRKQRNRKNAVKGKFGTDPRDAATPPFATMKLPTGELPLMITGVSRVIVTGWEA